MSNNNNNNIVKRRFNSMNDIKDNNNHDDNIESSNDPPNEIYYLTPSSNNKYLSKYNSQSELNELIGLTCRFILSQQSKNKIIKLSMLSKYLLKYKESDNIDNIYSSILA